MKSLIVYALSLSLILATSPSFEAHAEEGSKRTFEIQTKGEDTYKNEDALTLLTLVATGFFIASLWRYKPMTKDMWIATSAGILLIAAEIMALSMTREKITDENYKVTVNEDGSTNNMQTDAFKEQKQSYDELEKLAAIKWKIQTAASTAFFAAAGSAFFLHASWVKARGSCGASLAATSCAPAVAAHGSQEKLILDPLMASTKKTGALNAAQNTKLAALKTCTAAALAATPVSAALVKVLTVATKSCEVETGVHTSVTSSESTPADKILVNSEFSTIPEGLMMAMNPKEKTSIDDLKKLALELSSVFISNAHAFKLSMLGLGAVAAGIVMKLMKLKFPILDKAMATPLHRGIAFTAAGVIAGGAGVMSKKLEGQMGENKEKIDEVINKMQNLQNSNVYSGNGLAKTTQNTSEFLAPNDEGIIELSSNGEKISCAGEMQNSEGQCKNIEKEMQNSFGFDQFGGNLLSLANLSARTSDNILNDGGLSAGTLEGLDGLANNNAVARRRAREVEDHINKLNESYGNPQNDFAAMVDDFIGQKKAVITNELDKNGVSPKNLMAGWFSDNEDALAKEDKTEISEVLVENAPSIEPMKKEAIEPKDEKEEDEDLFFGFTEEDLNIDDMGISARSNSSISIDDYETSQKEIVRNPDTSLFQIITIRYFKSGYPRLLEERTILNE